MKRVGKYHAFWPADAWMFMSGDEVTYRFPDGPREEDPTACLWIVPGTLDVDA